MVVRCVLVKEDASIEVVDLNKDIFVGLVEELTERGSMNFCMGDELFKVCGVYVAAVDSELQLVWE